MSSTLLDEDRTKLAQVLGMKPSEILTAVELPDADPAAVIVETHDHQLTKVTADGTIEPWTGPLPVDVHPDDVLVADPAADSAPAVPVDPADGPLVTPQSAPVVSPADPDAAIGKAVTAAVVEDGLTPGADDPDAVPDGNAEVVLAWVGDDPDRARLALVAEQTRERPRSTLTAQLDRLAQQA